jgi:tRNA(Arg) A34 adenosine deaminase TadA
MKKIILLALLLVSQLPLYAQTQSAPMTPEEFMRLAIRLSDENMAAGGGPFGAVIVRDGKVVATGTNRVTPNCDPTAHAEVSAIRAACTALNTFDLTGCEIYTSCEPCPMCLGAIYWAHLDRMYYGNTKDDAARIGFDDAFIYKELELPTKDRRLQSKELLRNEAIRVFDGWMKKTDKVEY